MELVNVFDMISSEEKYLFGGIVFKILTNFLFKSTELADVNMKGLKRSRTSNACTDNGRASYRFVQFF